MSRPRQPGPPRGAAAICAALVVVEIAGFVALMAPIPIVWLWIGAQVYVATGSIGADLLVAFGGFFVTVLLTMRALSRIDELWVEFRRRAGHDQRQGALSWVVIVSMTVALILFWIWFHIIEDAFIIPFMPLN